MVNLGKPSRGCFKCRKRKVKCDEARPGCGNCERLRFPCPGYAYRDAQDLLFKDQTRHVEQRARATKGQVLSIGDDAIGFNRAGFVSCSDDGAALALLPSPPSPGFVSGSSFSPSFQLSPGYLTSPSPLSTSLQFPFEEIALTYCLNNFTPRPSLSYDSLYVPIASLQISSPLLKSCTAAIGYASLANIENRWEVRMSAYKSYRDALRHTNDAWSSVVVQRASQKRPDKEQTKVLLAGVMLLSVFEVVACNARTSLSIWTKHIEAIVSLLRLGLFQDEPPDFFFLKTLNDIRSSMVICNLINGYTNLDVVLELSRRYSPFYELSTPELFTEHRITSLFERLCLLFSRCQDPCGGLDEYNHLLAVAEQITHEYRALMPESFARSEAYLRTTTVDSMLVYKGEYYVLPSMFASNKLSHSRCIAFILLETVLWTLRIKYERFGCDPDIPHGSSFTLSGIKDALRTLSLDVARTVPYRFGLVDQLSGDIRSSVIPPMGIHGLKYIWALFFAGRAASKNLTNQPDLEQYCINVLDYIKNTMGVNQARRLAETLRTHQQPMEMSHGPLWEARLEDDWD